jgi:hypothetical protein
VTVTRWKARVVMAAVLLPLALLVVRPARLAAWIGRRRRAADTAPPDLDFAEWTDRVLSALPPPWRRNCMRRSVVLQYLLQRAGRPATLNVGVRRTAGGRLDAHAWLSRDGVAVLEPIANQAESYRVMASFPSP